MLPSDGKVFFQPIKKTFEVKQIQFEGERRDWAKKGDTVDVFLKLKNKDDFEILNVGQIGSEPLYPIPFVRVFVADIQTYILKKPIIPGMKFKIHQGYQTDMGKVRSLRFLYLDDGGKKQKPRVVLGRQKSRMEIELETGMCLENARFMDQYSRVILSDQFQTIAFGEIVELIE